jgi:hypothetical protein
MNTLATQPVPGLDTLWLNSANNHLYRDGVDIENQNPGPAPFAMANLYVSVAGNDTTGNGSITNPYLTIGKALNSTFTAGPTLQNVINVGPGIWSEVLHWKPYVTMQGEGTTAIGGTAVATGVTVFSGTIDLNNALYHNGNVNTTQFNNIHFSSLLTLDMTVQTAINTSICFFNCLFDVACGPVITGVGTGPTIGQGIFNNCIISDVITITDYTYNFNSCILGTFQYTETGGVIPMNFTVTNSTLTSILLTATIATTACSILNSIITSNAATSVLLQGAAIALNINSDSLPTNNPFHSISLSNGSTIVNSNGITGWTDPVDSNVVIGSSYQPLPSGGSTFIGSGAGNSGTANGGENTLIGSFAGSTLSTVLGTGNDNTLIGANSGINLVSGNNNTVVGFNTTVGAANNTNCILGVSAASNFDTCICLGFGATSSANNQLSIGSAASAITTAATATAGGGQVALATVLGYLPVNLNGTVVKIPFFSV